MLSLTLLAANTAVALNLYQDIFVTLSARPLGMGGCGVSHESPASVFYNPAGLASLRQFTLMHNHSARHFPGSRAGRGTEWDQLDGDTQAVIVPLPIGTYAHGFSLDGEMGYDYRNHPMPGEDFDYPGEEITAALGYPRAHYDAREDYDAFGTSFGLPCSFGYSLRRSVGRYTPANDASPDQAAWVRVGEGQQWGLLARVWPSLSYGYSEQKLDHKYSILSAEPLAPGVRVDKQGNVLPLDDEPQFQREVETVALSEMQTRLLTKRSGFCLRPTGWLALCSEQATEDYRFRQGHGLGILQDSRRERTRTHSGGELRIGQLATYRWGRYDGQPTVGLSFNLLGAWLNYAEVEGLLPEIIGAGGGADGKGYSDIHIYGFELPLW